MACGQAANCLDDVEGGEMGCFFPGGRLAWSRRFANSTTVRC
jgi:hypothetical protein